MVTVVNKTIGIDDKLINNNNIILYYSLSTITYFQVPNNWRGGVVIMRELEFFHILIIGGLE